MKLTYKQLFGIALLGLALTTGCTDDLLDKDPVTQLSGESFNSQENLEAALFATYDVLQWQVLDGVHVFPLMWQGVRADDIHSQFANFWAAGAVMDNFNLMQPDNPSVEKLWKKWYTGVARANLVIEKANLFNDWDSEATRNQVIAEAQTLRAFYYFELLRMWGGVPLVLNAVESTNDLPPLTRASEAEVYAQIDADLQAAIPNLPARSASELGRVTSGMAQTLLAKSKLYQEDYAACATLCQTIMASGEYQLEPNFADNFSLDNENGMESILEIQYEDGFSSLYFEAAGTAAQGSAMWQMSFMWVSGRYTSFSNFLPNGDLTGIYDRDNDSRFDATFITTGTDIGAVSPTFAANGWTVVQADQMSWLRPDIEDCNYSRKYWLTWEELDGLLATSQSPKNEKVFRYAEVLLMAAEAAAMGGGGNGAAALTELRARAGLPAVALTLDAVKLERRRELATEGWNRFSDLVRWGDAATNARMMAKNYTPGRDEHLPIPQAEIELIGASVLEQNPGY